MEDLGRLMSACGEAGCSMVLNFRSLSCSVMEGGVFTSSNMESVVSLNQ